MTPRVFVWWTALAALTVALSLLAPCGVLRDGGLPVWAGVALVCTELVALAILLLLVAAALALLRRLAEKASRPAVRILLRGLRYVVAGGALFAYVASWTSFCVNGHFLGKDGIEFCAANGLALARYLADMYPVLLVAVPAAIVPLAVLAADGIPSRRPLRLRLGPVAALAFFLCALGAFGGEMAGRNDEAYRFRRDYGSGPSVRAVAELLEPPSAPPPGPRRFRSRPISAYRAFPLRRWNVLIVTVDSLRADAIRPDVAPVLHALGRESRVFTDCTTQASHTDYASICPLSSHYPLRSLGVHRYPRNPSYPRTLLYDALKPLGYRTALLSSQNETWGQMLNYLDTGNLDRIVHAGNTRAPDDGRRGDNPDGDLDDALTIDAAMEWVGGGEPFFVALNLQNAHFPYATPPEFRRRYGPQELDVPLAFGSFPREKAAEVREYYLGSVNYVDFQLGRLFERLRERGVWDRTVVIVTADHGEAFYEKGAAAHGGPLTEEVLRVPLIVRVPGLAAGPDPRPAESIDIPPTVLSALDLPPHPGFQGVDLLGEESPRLRFSVVQTPFARQYAVVTSDRKLVYDARLRRSILYDRADRPVNEPHVARELEGELGAWVHAQVAYYEDRARHPREYPPIR